jgi:hypothetical protein
MVADPATVRATWEDSHNKTRTLIGGISDADLERPTDNAGWTVRNLAAHIAEADALVASSAKRLSQGKNPFFLPLPTPIANWLGNMRNKSSVKKYRAATTAELVTLADTAHAKACEALDGIPADGWHKAAKVPAIGVHTLASFIGLFVDHTDEHSAVLKKALPPSA